MEITLLSESIEKLREELNTILERDCLNSIDVLEVSHKLDVLILKYLDVKNHV